MNKFAVKNRIAVFAALILGLIPFMGFAQTRPEPWPNPSGSPLDVKGFDKSIFDYHFSRADRELSPDRWISEARRGIGLALNAWELFASSLYDNPLILDGAKKQIEKWSAQELEERFTRWLTGRFFGDAAQKASARFSAAMGETRLRYTYHQDAEGNIVYDDRTGDPSVIRPGEEGREFSADLSWWRGAAEQNITNEAASFEAAIARMYPELLAYIPPEMRESLGAKIAAAGSAFSETARKEFENLAAREERIFTGRRTGDVWSLRKKNDDEAARAITAQLIGEAEDVCARGIAGLASRIEEASAGSGDLVLMGKEWLQMYQEQFERGLKAWEQAEERFFIRRIEWEQEAGRLFTTGEESWLAAFSQFEDERKKWELTAKELFESGEALFRNASENLEKAITQAKIEFEYNFQMRTDAGTSRARALIDMYLTCGSGAAAARENILFWLKQYNAGNKPDPADTVFNAWLEDEIKKQGSQNAASPLGEIKKSYNLYVSCLNKAKDVREKLVADYQDLIGSGTLKDILSSDASSEDFSLDEYQAALLKAKTLVQYWERQTAIAQAVSDYAQDVSAGRITDAEGLRAWEAAKAAYNETLSRYEQEVQSLNAIGADMREKQAALDALASEMKAAEEALNALNLDYSALIAANAVNRESYVLVEFNAKYTALLSEYRLLTRTGNGALHNNSLEYALDLGLAQYRETAAALAAMLINGDGGGLESLAALRDAAAADPGAEMALRVRLCGLDLLNAESGAEWYCNARGIALSEAEKAELKGKKLWARLTADAENGDPFSSELLLLYENFGGAALFAAKEAWEDAIQDLGLLFAAYGLDAAGSPLPDIQSLYAALAAMPGDFVLNAAELLRSFDRCFVMLPEWLEYEISGWKDSFAAYVAHDALRQGKIPLKDSEALSLEQEEIENRYQTLDEYYISLANTDEETLRNINRAYAQINEDEILLFYKSLITGIWEQNSREAADAEKEKIRHWRQYLADEYLNEPDSLIARAASWKEGAMLDALDSAIFCTGRVSGAFALYASLDWKKQIRETDMLLENYESETGLVENHLNNAAVLREELARLGRSYEYTRMAPDAFKKELDRQYTALKARETAFDTLRVKYLRDAEGFAAAGARYDSQYTKTKKAYENMEEKRFEYETQDAIRRWASTAYLGYEGGDLDNCKTRLQKSRTVLAVLSDLYNNEERRPYDNPAYQAIYSEYEQSFKKALVSFKVFNTLRAAITEETMNNNNTYAAYQTWLNAMGTIPEYAADYISSANKSLWGIEDIITLQNGRLAFSKNGSMRLDGIDSNDTRLLRDFFAAEQTIAGERHESSHFETALRELNQRLENYFSNSKKMSQWGLARDYLLRTLSDSNKDIDFLQDKYMRAGPLMKGGSLARAPYKTDLFEPIEYIGDYISGRQNSIRKAQQKAWDTLSDTEKADLEFYVILTLSGTGGNYLYGFSQYTALKEFQSAYDKAKKHYWDADDKVKNWPLAGLLYIEMRDINKSSYNRLKPPLEQTKTYIAAWEQGALANINRVKDYASAYAVSCARLDALEGAAAPGQNVGWNEISRALKAAGSLQVEDLATVKAAWEAMLRDAGGTYTNVFEALAQVALWAGSERDKNKTALENQWRLDEQDQREKEQDFLASVEAFYAGNADVKTLSASANAAYGKNAAAWKNHFSNIEKALIHDLEYFPVYGSDYLTDFSVLGNEYVSLIAGTLANRYNAELAVRTSEWEEQRRDLAEKYRTWQETAALMTETGREDWKISALRMEESYRQWSQHFIEEQKRISSAWAEAYLAGLEDKEQWLEQAAAAADRASSEALLSAVGAEAERLARVMDTREPVGIRDALPEVEKLLAELLNTPGLGNIGSAFRVLNGMADLSSAAVKRGMGGVSTWDAIAVKAAAADLARETNAELAAREAQRLAFSARAAAMEALKSLAGSVETANSNTRENMDQTYIVQGQWRKSGKKYIKDIIVGSTVFQPVITEEKKVEAYIDYRMEPFALKTNLDENYLAGLNAFAITGLIENVYEEIEAVRIEIFGNGEIQKIQSNAGERSLGSGKFGAHAGYGPALRPSAGSGTNRNSMFYDQGSGETGRLLTEFYYWSIIDGRGVAKLSVATWDKPLWDDKGSSFAAPSIRTVAEIGGQVAAAIVGVVAAVPTGGASALGMMALIVGINTTDDLVFNAMDAAYNYKTIDEAGFAFGKSVAISSASAIGSGAFNGVAGVAGNGFLSAGNGLTGLATGAAEGIGKTAIQTVMTGAQTITTGLATSAINGVTYSSENGWGYSSEVFAEGMKGTMISALSSMTSSLTSGILSNINNGLTGEKLIGYSGLNRRDLGTLNNTIGGLAGQGVQYALGGDFTLNVLNAGLFTNQRVNAGLLELRLGHDGSPKMNLGTGGADVSPNTIASAVRGALVWDINNRIDRYAAKNNFDAKVTLRAEYGMGGKVQKGQLREILKGKAVLNTGVNGDARGETVTADGKRIVNLNGYRPGMSIEEQMALAITLGHEAYRDGVVTADNKLETRDATLAHTEMALRILQEGYALNDANLAADIAAYLKSAGNTDAFNDYVDRTYDSSGDYWKLVYDKNGNAFLEYDGLADIFDAEGNFLVGAGTSPHALQTALGKYLNISLAEAGKLLSNTGFEEENNSWVTDKNTGKRIAIGRYADQDVSNYIYAAHRVQGIRAAISGALSSEENIESARNILYSEMNGSNFDARYIALRQSLIDFYLPSTNMFNGIASVLTTDAGNPANYPTNLHKGNDYAAAEGSVFNTLFSGIVKEISSPNTIVFENLEAYNKSRNSYSKDENHQWVFTHHDDRKDTTGNTIYLKDQNARGNGVIIEHGIKMNDAFLSLGFTTRSNHFSSVMVGQGQYLTSGTGIGTVGNSGWSTGPHVDYNMYFRAGSNNAISNLYKLGVSINNWNGDVYVNPKNIYQRFK